MTVTVAQTEQSQTWYKYESALETSKEYFGGEELPATVFLNKYAYRDPDNRLLENSPDQMHWRIANEFARIEAKKFKSPYSAQEIYERLKGFNRIVPQGSPMFGIGNKHQFISLSNCYVVPSPEDSYASILQADERLIQISKRRGGVGVDISNLRPSGFITKNAAKTSSGAVTFASRFSASIREVAQNGRRGALMMTMSVYHTNIMEFIVVKNDEKKVTGANISVRIGDDFMKAVMANGDYTIRWPVTGEARVSEQISAAKVWDTIITSAHAKAEPGVLFWDTIIRESPADCYLKFGFGSVSTNPCSEIPLSAFDSCRLLLLNLFGYIIDPFTAKARFDWKLFKADVVFAQRLMDDLIDLEVECIDRIIAKINSDPESDELKASELKLWKDIRRVAITGRRTGLGLTAVGDCLAALGVTYGSEDSIKQIDELYKQLKIYAYKSSVDMAKELGPFPIFDPELEKNNPFLLRLKDDAPDVYAEMQKYGRRNIALLTTAPAGTVSVETQTTSGIEPLFDDEPTIRRVKGNPGDPNFRSDFVDPTGDHWMHHKVYHPKLKMWMAVTGETDTTKSPWHNCTANKLDWMQRVRIQATAQKHIDHAISSTVNLPEDTPVETVDKIYKTAWQLGCKGITIYRDKCRTGVLIREDSLNEKKETPAKRPESLDCKIYHFIVNKDPYFVLISCMNDKPYELFAGLNVTDSHDPIIPKQYTQGTLIKKDKGHYCGIFTNSDGDELKINKLGNLVSSEEGAITRLISTSLRNGIPLDALVHQLEKVKGDMFSFTKCIARALKKYIPDGTAIPGETCANCNAVGSIVRQEGCLMCKACGNSKCG